MLGINYFTIDKYGKYYLINSNLNSRIFNVILCLLFLQTFSCTLHYNPHLRYFILQTGWRRDRMAPREEGTAWGWRRMRMQDSREEAKYWRKYWISGNQKREKNLLIRRREILAICSGRFWNKEHRILFRWKI